MLTEPAVLLVLGSLVVVGELRPIMISRGDDSVDIVTISSCFSVALVLHGPVVVALGVQALALAIDDVRTRRSPLKWAFNQASYQLSLLLARGVYCAATGRSLLVDPTAFRVHDVLPALAAALCWYVVNQALLTGVMCVAAAEPFGRTLRHELRSHSSSVGVLLALAPVVVHVVTFSPLLVLLLLLPMFSLHKSAELAVERERQALHDALTGLPNRALFNERAARAVRARDSGLLAVMLTDLDHFKEINDTLGHHVGDRLLVEVAARIRAAVREEDFVARIGGDEFAIVCADLDGPEAAEDLAARVVAAMEAPFSVDGVRLTSARRVGIALAPDHGDHAQTLLQRADVALYAAKVQRGTWSVYVPEEDGHSLEKLALLGELRDGVDRDELVVHYQPLCDATTGALLVGRGAGALAAPDAGPDLPRPVHLHRREHRADRAPDPRRPAPHARPARGLGAGRAAGRRLGQPLGPPAHRPRPARAGRAALARSRADAGPAGPRGHRVAHRLRRQPDGRRAARAAQRRGPDRCRRLRHRLLVPDAAARPVRRRPQDRPVLRHPHVRGRRTTPSSSGPRSTSATTSGCGWSPRGSRTTAPGRRSPSSAATSSRATGSAGRCRPPTCWPGPTTGRPHRAKERCGRDRPWPPSCSPLLAVPLLGGRLSRLGALRLQHLWLVPLALVLQLMATTFFPRADPALLDTVHVSTYVLALGFTVLNRRVPGLVLLGVGAASNGITISLNAGVLPASAHALAESGFHVTPGRFTNSGVLPDPVLPWLGDVFWLPAGVPLHNVFSIGDVLIVLGATWLVHRTCRPQPAASAPTTPGPAR